MSTTVDERWKRPDMNKAKKIQNPRGNEDAWPKSKLTEVEIGRSRTDGVCSVSSFSLSCFFFYFVFLLFVTFFLVLTHLSLHFVVVVFLFSTRKT